MENGVSIVNKLCVFWYHGTKSVITVQRKFLKEFDWGKLKECPFTKGISCSMRLVAFVKEEEVPTEKVSLTLKRIHFEGFFFRSPRKLRRAF